MTSGQANSTGESRPATSLPQPTRRITWNQIGFAVQFVLALGLTIGVLSYLLTAPGAGQDETGHQSPVARPPVVQVVGQYLLHVQPGTPLDDKLHLVTTRTSKLTNPVLTVTGRVVASLRPGKAKGKDYWQFEAPEVLSAYSDWEKALADIAFTETQLVQVRDLVDARLVGQQKVVARLKNLVESGTESLKDLVTEETNLLQYRLTGKKEVYEAESAIRIARRAEAVTARQLQQFGLEPELLRSATSDIDVVMADVPEGRLTQVKIGQGCVCEFFGVPQQSFSGKLTSIAPVLSKERRSLRVLLIIDDPKDQLRSGMFAEVGLGTDPREALLMPVDGVLHVTRSDYVLAAVGDNTWRVTEVQVGEPHNGDVEILHGLRPGERVLGKGAILLKPLVILSLQSQSAPRITANLPRVKAAP